MATLRIVLYAPDIAALLGCSECSAYRLIAKIRKQRGSVQKFPLSVKDFCAFTNLDYEEVMGALNGSAVLEKS